MMIPMPLLSLGCATTVVAPSNVAEPVVVYLADHGRHPSIVLPHPDGGYVRYVYGGWSWYAEGKTALWRVFPTLLWPNQGALGRGRFDSLEALQRHDPVENLYVLQLERASVEHLRTSLESRFQSQLSTYHANELYHLEFVHDDQRYGALHNCNHVMVDWLKQLGCRVSGPVMLSIWKIEQVSSSPASAPVGGRIAGDYH